MNATNTRIRVLHNGEVWNAELIENRQDTAEVVYRLADGPYRTTSIDNLRPVCTCGSLLRVCHERFVPAPNPLWVVQVRCNLSGREKEVRYRAATAQIVRSYYEANDYTVLGIEEEGAAPAEPATPDTPATDVIDRYRRATAGLRRMHRSTGRTAATTHAIERYEAGLADLVRAHGAQHRALLGNLAVEANLVENIAQRRAVAAAYPELRQRLAAVRREIRAAR